MQRRADDLAAGDRLAETVLKPELRGLIAVDEEQLLRTDFLGKGT